MTVKMARLAVGARVIYDGEAFEVVEICPAAGSGNDVVLKSIRLGVYRRVPLREVLFRADKEAACDGEDVGGADSDEAQNWAPASVVLAELSDDERNEISQRAGHIREVLTGYQTGNPGHERDKPHPQYAPDRPKAERYKAKADELGVGVRTIERWVQRYRADGEAGLAPRHEHGKGPASHVDPRWMQIALEVMVEHTELSRPSRSLVIKYTNARVAARWAGAVELPARATAFRALAELEKQHPTFRLSTKRNRDIAGRPGGVYGKLRPTRPGEYMLMDTTRLDVFALDQITLQWVQAELTVGMDWYTRCITGIRLTPVSTKSVDAADVLYQSFRPKPAGEDWPDWARWPDHGVPRSVLVEQEAIENPAAPGRSGPAIAPETIVVDHGKIYLSEHLNSVCQRMGISIQPARLRTGRDKGPVERFFRTLREDLLQMLPGYKGPDVHSRGVNPESEAFFFLDELEAIIREWVALIYHHRPHGGLVEPRLPGLDLSPAVMFEHGIARAGYIEVPPDPDLWYEFLKVKWRTIQHYGVEFGGCKYNGEGLPAPGTKSPFKGKAKESWPIHYSPDDITRCYFRNPETQIWHTLTWEHAPANGMAFSEDALAFARKMCADKYRYPDDRLAVADLMERWNLGLGASMAERRIALRLSRETPSFESQDPADATAISNLPSVAHALSAVPVTESHTAPPTPATRISRLETAAVESPPTGDEEDDDVDEEMWEDV